MHPFYLALGHRRPALSACLSFVCTKIFNKALSDGMSNLYMTVQTLKVS